jgi:putative (di)nucleoside polyphosphate hydrolase
MAESFRAGAGIVVVDGERRVLVLERADVPGAWQLPQGGIEPGESPEDAAWRELAEETGLDAGSVEAVEQYRPWLGYELPEEHRSPKTGRGQVHAWFIFRVRSNGPAPDLSTDAILGGGEFNAARWVSLDQLVAGAAAFRRPVYQTLARRVTDLELLDRLDRS